MSASSSLSAARRRASLARELGRRGLGVEQCDGLGSRQLARMASTVASVCVAMTTRARYARGSDPFASLVVRNGPERARRDWPRATSIRRRRRSVARRTPRSCRRSRRHDLPARRRRSRARELDARREPDRPSSVCVTIGATPCCVRDALRDRGQLREATEQRRLQHERGELPATRARDRAQRRSRSIRLSSSAIRCARPVGRHVRRGARQGRRQGSSM